MALSSSHWIATEAEYRAYATAPGADATVRIQSALRVATTFMERRLGREVVSRGSLTEYHSLPWEPCRKTIQLLQFPLLSVTSVHESTDSPRVYDSTTLLTVDTDYQVDSRRGWLHRISSSELYPWSSGRRAIKVVYAAGWAQADVPDELKQLCLFGAFSVLKEASLQRHGVSAVTDDTGNYTRFIGYYPPDMLAMMDAYAMSALTFDSTGEAA